MSARDFHQLDQCHRDALDFLTPAGIRLIEINFFLALSYGFSSSPINRRQNRC
jgi:hypothetical protein